jgi:ClpP class serine protease
MSLFLILDDEMKMIERLNEKIFSSDSTITASSDYSAMATPMQWNGDTAEIDISGVLAPERNQFYDMFGIQQTAYSDIQAQLSDAVSRGAKNINFNIDSGGGDINGMLNTMKAMSALKGMGIKTKARVKGRMASAAYMLGSQADSITASSETDVIGSIGVVRSYSTSMFSKDITNHESKNKRPDIKTEEGLKAVKDELSDFYNVIMPYVADARGVSVEDINNKWGKGGVMTAKTALSKGMIDAIEDFKPASRSGVDKGYKSMNREELKATHPDLFEAILNEGKEAGKAEVKELAEAHLELARISGDKDRALEDIAAFNKVTPACTVHHTNVAAKNAAIQNRAGEAPEPVGEGDPAQNAALNGNKEEEAMEADLLMAAKAFGGKLS